SWCGAPLTESADPGAVCLCPSCRSKPASPTPPPRRLSAAGLAWRFGAGLGVAALLCGLLVIAIPPRHGHEQDEPPGHEEGVLPPQTHLAPPAATPASRPARTAEAPAARTRPSPAARPAPGPGEVVGWAKGGPALPPKTAPKVAPSPPSA